MQESTAMYSLSEIAERLCVSEATVREWLATFAWERHYDGEGHLYLSSRDVDFLHVIKALKEADASCESIVRVLSTEHALAVEKVVAAAEVETESEPEPAPVGPDAAEKDRTQLEELKAELRALHARPARKPFWKFWG